MQNWQDAVCVSKNAGGTKRVTSLADALKLNFGMVTTDKRRTTGGNMSASMIMRSLDGYPQMMTDLDSDVSGLQIGSDDSPLLRARRSDFGRLTTDSDDSSMAMRLENTTPRLTHSRQDSGSYTSSPRKNPTMSSPLRTAHNGPIRSPLARATSTPTRSSPIEEEAEENDNETGAEIEFIDERARDITQARLVQGHIVPDDYPSPTISAMSSSVILERPEEDEMEMSRNSSFFEKDTYVLGGTADATATSDEEEESFKNPGLEQMITLVGDVRGRTVFIVDDMIDKAGSWIAEAECVVKRGGAKKVYCIATHGLFGGDALEDLQDCDCIDAIVVTNSFPIPQDKARATKKLVILDLSNLLAEAIRRNHYGESLSALFTHSYD